MGKEQKNELQAQEKSIHDRIPAGRWGNPEAIGA
jgi:hypothetical protein